MKTDTPFMMHRIAFVRSWSLLTVTCVALLCASRQAIAQECTSQWVSLLDTDPSHPKAIAGDTAAAYAWFNFSGDPSKKLVLQAEFPHARFMSVESNETRWGMKGEALFDYQIEPDRGSQNPFQPGVALEVADRAFTVEVLPARATSSAPNVIHLGQQSQLQQSVLLRIYSPNGGAALDASVLPRIFAYDLESGEPTSCPESETLTETLDLPQFLTLPVTRQTSFGFFNVQVPWGPNSAIPAYLGGVDRMQTDDIAIIQFTAPTHVDTGGDGEFTGAGNVRYWSFCSANLVELITLNCIPDFMAQTDRQGGVTIVFGQGADLQVAAEARGYTFLEDTRASNQPVAEFVYRNILPSADFAAGSLYQNTYRPQGHLCSRDAFLAGTCD